MMIANANVIGNKPLESAASIAQAFVNRIEADGGLVEARDCLESRIELLRTLGLWNKASAVWFPHGYKEDKLYAVKGGTIADLTITRAGTRTRKGPTYIEQVPYNLLQRSQDFDHAYWVKAAEVTVSADNMTAPDGTLTADEIIKTGTGTFRNVSTGTAITVGINGTYTYSVRVKPNTAVSGRILALGATTNAALNINWATDGIDLGDGWRLHTLTFVALDSAINFYIYPTGIGVEAGSIYAWGAQVVVGSEPLDYFRTTDRFSVPALDYTYSTCPALSLEPARTNLFIRSSELDNVAWLSSGTVTVTPNASADPEGYNSAERIATTGASSRFQNVVLVTGTVYTISCWVKAVTPGSKNLFRLFGDSTLASSDFIATGDWQRFRYTFTSTSSVSKPNGITRPVSNADTDLYVWGMQLEIGSYVTSYIPTTVAAVSRLADLTTVITGATTLIDQSEGAIFIDFEMDGQASFSFPIAVGDGTTNNAVVVFVNASGTIETSVAIGGVSETFFTKGSGAGFNTRTKILVRYSATERCGFYNGGKETSFTTPVTIPAMDRIAIGKRNTNVNPFEGWIYQAIVFKGSISDAEAIALTTL